MEYFSTCSYYMIVDGAMKKWFMLIINCTVSRYVWWFTKKVCTEKVRVCLVCDVDGWSMDHIN